jgi:hypothetical protein
MKTTIISLIALLIPVTALAQKRPPTVRNVHPSEVRLPTVDERGLWQLLSHQNNPEAICGPGKTLAVHIKTRQVVCWVPMQRECRELTDPMQSVLHNVSRKLGRARQEKDQETTELNKLMKQISDANREDKRYTRKAADELDISEKIKILEQQVEHKQQIVTMVRKRDAIKARLNKLEKDVDRFEQEAKEADKNIRRVKNNSVPCEAKDDSKGWFAERHAKGKEYVLADPQLKGLLRDAIQSAVTASSGDKLKIQMEILNGIEMEIKRVQYAGANGLEGLDQKFWWGVVTRGAEIGIHRLGKFNPKIRAVSKALPWGKLAAAATTSYIYGFAAAP